MAKITNILFLLPFLFQNSFHHQNLFLMAKLTPFIFCCLISFTLLAQQNSDDNLIRCYTTEHEEELRAKYPNMPTVEEFEAWFGPQVQANKEARRNNPQRNNMTIIIPVVVHVLHNDDDANISDAQVLSQIDVLNEDFQRIPDSRGAETTSIGGHDYSQITAPMDIEFRMARTGPNGELTDGINRVNLETEFQITGGANRTELEDVIKPGTIWDPNKYMNMWTVKFKAPDDNLLGYAQFPFDSGLEGMESADNVAETDGVVQLYRAFGTQDQDDGSFDLHSTYGLGRTATHEVGHWVGLRHIWGDGLCLAGTGAGCACHADDFCEDTPNSGQPNSDCQGTEISTCPTRVGPDMVENYMDYSADACMNIFTNDQIDRMYTVLDVSPRRKELKTSLTYLPPGNFVQFEQGESQIVEGSGCNARAVNVGIKGLGTPTGDISVTLAVMSESGTATEGLWEDFELTTTDLTLTAPDYTANAIINLYEDNVIESAEDFTIVIQSVTGGDAEIGQTNIEHTIIIMDDDVEPLNGGASAGQVIFSEDFEAGSPTVDQWSQNGSSFLVSWGVGTANGGLETESAYVQDMTGSYSYGPQSPAANIRYDSPDIDANGATDMTLTFDYISNGERGNDTDYDYGSIWYSVDGGEWSRLSNVNLNQQAEAASFSVPLPVEANGANALKIGFQWQHDAYFGDDKPLSFDNVMITGTRGGASNIATLTTANTTDAYIKAGDQVHFYDENGNIMATIENADQDLGCTMMQIISDGEGANIDLSNNPGSEAASKLFTITPALNGSTANYDLTLYYTKNEVDTWIADLANNSVTVTEQDFRLFKSADTDVANASGIVVYDATSFETYNVNGIDGYALKGNFTGFSTFGGTNLENPFTVTADITDVTCVGGNDGAISLTPNTIGWQYSWESGQITADIDGLTAGIYSVTVTNLALEQFIGSFEVQDGTPISATFNRTEATCDAADASAEIMVTDAAATYTIDWKDEQGTSIGAGDEGNTTISGLAGGNYTAVVTDANTCTAEFAFEIVKNSGDLAVTGQVTDVLCKLASTGAVDLTVNNATGTPTASWSNGATTLDLMDVPAAAYSVDVTDDAGCLASEVFVVNEPETAISATPVLMNETNCGDADGSISLTPSGGTTTGNYSFAWEDDANANSTSPSNSRSGLSAGEYQVSITDDNNCELVLNPFITCADNNLAVELIGFQVVLNKQKDAVLTWHTANENQFSHYEVLRLDDNRGWEALEEVAALRNVHNDYRFVDTHLDRQFSQGAKIYYQLKMVNADGSFELSSIESVVLPVSEGTWILFPNPASTEVEVVINSTQQKPASLDVFSVQGQLLKTFTIANPSVNTRFSLNISDLSMGVYMVRLNLEEGQQQLKLVVK